MVYLQARGLDFFQRLRFGRPLSMHARMLRSELFRAFRDATILQRYFALPRLTYFRGRHADAFLSDIRPEHQAIRPN